MLLLLLLRLLLLLVLLVPLVPLVRVMVREWATASNQSETQRGSQMREKRKRLLVRAPPSM
jgi:hypothetical protein